MENATLFCDQEGMRLRCGCCKREISPYEPALIQISRNPDGKLVRCVPCHKGECDKRLSKTIPQELTDGWLDIEDVKNPYIAMKYIINLLQDIEKGVAPDPSTIEDIVTLILYISPFVLRNPTHEEVTQLLSIG